MCSFESVDRQRSRQRVYLFRTKHISGYLNMHQRQNINTTKHFQVNDRLITDRLYITYFCC